MGSRQIDSRTINSDSYAPFGTLPTFPDRPEPKPLEPTWLDKPALLKRHGLPAAPEKLSLFPTLDSVVQQGRYVWKLVAPDGHQLEYQHQPRLVSDDMEILRQTALAGLGVVRLPETMCKADLAAGKLSIVLPDWSVSPNLLYATYLSRRGLMPAVRHFIDFLSAPLGESPASEKKGTK